MPSTLNAKVLGHGISNTFRKTSMGKSCKETAQSFVECMKNSSCVKNGGDVKSCIKKLSKANNTDESAEVLEECQELRTAYTMCRRSGLDMRTRIRGPRVY